jgi:hypothetical protein
MRQWEQPWQLTYVRCSSRFQGTPVFMGWLVMIWPPSTRVFKSGKFHLRDPTKPVSLSSTDLRSRGSVSELHDVTRFAADQLVTRVFKSNSLQTGQNVTNQSSDSRAAHAQKALVPIAEK